MNILESLRISKEFIDQEIEKTLLRLVELKQDEINISKNIAEEERKLQSNDLMKLFGGIS